MIHYSQPRGHQLYFELNSSRRNVSSATKTKCRQSTSNVQVIAYQLDYTTQNLANDFLKLDKLMVS